MAVTPSTKRGKTPAQRRAEAEAEALNQQPEETRRLEIDDTASVTGDEPTVSSTEFTTAGETVDAQIPPAESTNVVSIAAPRKGGDDAKSTPPRVDEWQDFFSRIVIRGLTEWYLDAAFNGIDEELLTAREIESLQLSSEERHSMARPFAEFANKLKFTRKHGRTIIGATGSAESVYVLIRWTSRVNRISRKYRKLQQAQYTVYPPQPGMPPQEPQNAGEYVGPRQNQPPPAANGQRGFSLFNPGTG